MKHSFVLYMCVSISIWTRLCMLEQKFTLKVEPEVQKNNENGEIYIKVIQMFEVKETFYSKLSLEHKYSFRF